MQSSWVFRAGLALPVALAACTGGIGDGIGGAGPDDPDQPRAPVSGPPAPAPPPPAGTPVSVSGMRRLTSWEYDNTLRDLLRDNTRPSRAILPADERTPFDNDYTSQVASKTLIDGVELLAGEAVQRLLANATRRDAVVGCTPKSAGDTACFQQFVTRFGRRALRRPLAAEEVTRFQSAFLPLAVQSGDFYTAVDVALRAFLQHPETIYRVEVGAPVTGKPSMFRLNVWETGARLAFTLWGSPPDDILLDQAQAGGLTTTAGVRSAAARMLKDPRARELVARFHGLWLSYESMSAPTPELATAMQQESAATIGRIVFDEGRPWQDVFRLGETFVSDLLAKQYGLPLPGSTTPKWVGYGATNRQGLLSQGAFLSNGAEGGDTSITLRGKAVRELLLCEEIPPPPPGVDANLPAAAPTACKSDQIAAHSQGGCASCHSLMDPVGSGLENYDALGRYRTREATNRTCIIAGNGALSGVGTFRGPAELSNLLLKTGRLNACVLMQVYRFTMGHKTLDDADRQLVMLLADRIGTADFKLDDLLVDFVSADSFRFRREEG